MAAGWTAIPSVILDRQRELGLDALDLNIVVQLAKFWWRADDAPHPGKRTIASAIGVDPRTVQRRIAGLEARGLVRRLERRRTDGGYATNAYSFSGLIEAAAPFATEVVRERQERARLKRAELNRRRRERRSTARGGG